MKRLPSLAGAVLLAGAVCFAVTGCSTAEHDHAQHHAGHSEKPAVILPVTAYPFHKCLVCDMPLPNKPRTFVRTGQEVKLCSGKCLAEFNKTPDRFMAKIP
jgi:hypothetical protein